MDIVKYTKVVYIICVVYVRYLQIIQYNVIEILWHTCKMLYKSVYWST